MSSRAFENRTGDPPADAPSSAPDPASGANSAASVEDVLAENARLREELRLRNGALDATGTGIVIVDMQTKGRPIVYVNRAAAQRTGYLRHELLGQPSALLSPRDPNGDRVLQVRDAMRAGKELRVEMVAGRKDGSEYWAGVALTPVLDAYGKVTHYVSTSADITARRESDLQNKRDRERLAAVVETALEGVIAVNNQFQITLFNGAAEKIFGRPAAEMVGQPLDMLVPERFRAEHRQQIEFFSATGDADVPMSPAGALIGLRASGEEFPMEASISRVSVGGDTVLTVFLRDISQNKKAEAERLQLEAQLRLAQKLEAVGQLAAGIAHEINTPIQYVGDSVTFLQSAREDEMKVMDAYRDAIGALQSGAGIDAVQEKLHAAEKACDTDFYRDEIPKAFERTLQGIERVTSIVRAMKEFSHPDAVNHESADINHALETTLVVARNEYKYVATVETHFQELPEVVCNIGELNQVFLNILVNAAHAIEESGKDPTVGRISIATEVDGDYVKIGFEDNGCGIPQKHIDKVFDPFFTTKEVGKGTGQGLAITRSIIVVKHGGTVAVDTEVGVGTKFTLRLPIAGNGQDKAVQ